MGSITILDPPAVERDPEIVAYRGLARLVAMPPVGDVNEALERVAALARELTRARYAAVTVIDEHEHVDGFFVSGFDREALRRLKTAPQGHGPLGALRQGRAVRIDNLNDHPLSFGFPPRHPEMTALCGVPIMVRGDVRGSLYVTDRAETLTFAERDEIILQVLARYAGRVIEERW